MSSFYVSQLKYAVGLGGIMSFYGIVSIALWLMPGSSSMTQRIVIIALVLLTLPFVLLIGFVVTRKSNKKKEAAAAAKSAQAAPGGNGATAGPANLTARAGSYADLTSGAEEVIQFLKSSNLGAVGKEAAYSLPWYLVAGTATSGKSALVISSNLHFQPLPSQRQADLVTVRPTRSVDWRVTSDAVFLDTTGRYQSDGADADEWASLLETLRKNRSNRPIDGFLLIVNAKEILASEDHQIEEKAKVLRTRLDEALQRLKVRFPVYLIFTNADSIEGFSDSFSASKQEDKALVWGATIPIEKSENAQSLFDSEYEILHDSIMKRRLVRLSAPFPPVRQLRIFNFPLHFGSARRKLGAFVNALFRPSPFSENPFLRGFYFTAIPQAKSGGGAAKNGHSYFTERLFRDVILRDRDLVKTFQAQRQSPPILGWLLTFLLGFIVFVLLIMAGVSLYENKVMLDEAKQKGESIITIARSDAGKPVLTKSVDDATREINATEDMRELLSRLDDYDRNGPPIYMRMGLYSGTKIFKEQLLPNYLSVIEQRFKKPTVARVEAELQKFAASQPVANPGKLTDKDEETLGKNYDLLKAYLMLTGQYRDKAEASHIANTLRDYWVAEAKLPPGFDLVAQEQLEFWAKQVDRDEFPRIQMNQKLVADVRTKLQAFPAPNRYYKRQVTEISKQIDEKVGKTTVEGILARGGADDPSLLEGTYQVPGAYTKSGNGLMQIAILKAATELSSDDWVLGETGKQAIASTTDTAKVRDMYYRDYADHWRNFVRSTNVRAFKDRDDAANALQS
ncbi:MAG TPA: type VI secretion system membrane subunit TssM, partial [Pyrinomonadaceae bacterium]